MSALSKVAITVLLLAPVVCFAGSATPEEAIVEMLPAPNPEAAEKHLPKCVQEGLRTLTARERQAFEARLRFVDGFRQMGMEITEPHDGRSLLVAARADTEQRFELRVEHEAIGGAEAVLELNLQGVYGRRALLWMKFEDGEWRVTELEWLGGGSGKLVFDDPKLLEPFRNPELKELESSVRATLLQVSYAVQRYGYIFRDFGYPADLSVLGPPLDDEEESAEHAGYLEQSQAANSFRKDGYEFHYELRRGGKEGAFSITARPLQFGNPTPRSFYLDETMVIRATGENRQATADDDPVQ
jgi:hypothetical protein